MCARLRYLPVDPILQVLPQVTDKGSQVLPVNAIILCAFVNQSLSVLPKITLNRSSLESLEF